MQLLFRYVVTQTAAEPYVYTKLVDRDYSQSPMIGDKVLIDQAGTYETVTGRWWGADGDPVELEFEITFLDQGSRPYLPRGLEEIGFTKVLSMGAASPRWPTSDRGSRL